MSRTDEFIDMSNAVPEFLKIVATFDKIITVVSLQPSNYKRQSSKWKTKHFKGRKQFCLGKSKGRVMLEVFFFYYKGLIHYKFIPEENTVNKNKKPYLEILLGAYKMQSGGKSLKNGRKTFGFLLPDNAPAHRLLLVLYYLAKNIIFLAY